MKTVLLRANSAGTGPPSITCLYALYGNREPNPPAHLQRLYGIPSVPGADFFCGHEFIKFVSVNFPTCVVRSLLNVSQGSFMAMVPLAFDTHLKNCTPILT